MFLSISLFHRATVFSIPALSFLLMGFMHYMCPADAAEKDRVPTGTQQSETLKLVREIYQDDYKAAESAQQKSQLARKILKAGEETENDSVGRYVLIKLARDIAAQAGDVETAMSAIGLMDEFYEINEFDTRVSAIIDLAKRVDLEQMAVYFDQIAGLLDKTIANDDYDLAGQLVTAGKVAAEKSRDKQLMKIAQTMSDQLAEMTAAFAEVKDAFATLQTNPNDEAANLAVGKFQCLFKADWGKGLPMLAKSGDAVWQDPAKLELAGATNGAMHLQVADKWWELAQTLPESEQDMVKLHAGFFYQQAARELTGLEKAKAVSRMREAEKIGDIAAAEPKEDAPESDPEKAAPASLEIKPSQLQQAKVEYKLPASFDDMAIGGGGRYLIFHFKTLNKLGLFDVNEGKITEYISLENADIRFTAGAEALYIALRQQNVIQRWSLLTFEKELAVKLPFENPVEVIAMGCASLGPIFAGAKDPAGVFLDPKSLKPLSYTVVDHVYQKSDAAIPGSGPETRVRASANGQVFTSWGTSGSPGGFRTLLLAGKQVHTFYKHDTMGYIAPSPDGELIYTAKGVYTYQTKDFSGNVELFAKSFPVPALQGNYSLWVQRDDDQKKKEDPTASLTVHLNGDAKPILTLADISIRPGQYSDFHGRELMTLDRRICFIPPANLIITLPDSNQKVIMHSMNLDKEMEEAGIDYLYVTSRPAASARKGGSYRYQIDVKSKNGGVTFKLESGPDGMKVSDTGLVTWRVSRKADVGNQDAIVAIKDASGQEITHAFKIAVE